MKKNINKRIIFNKVFGGIFACICLALIISLADLFSGLITVGGYSFAGNNININEFNVYAVCTSNHDTKILADEMSDNVKRQGGAGYVYMNKQSYYVIAGIYETEADAEKVKQNLIANKPQTTVIKISSQAILLSSNLTQPEKEIVTESLLSFKTNYQKLYDISVSLDTNVTDEVNSRLDVNSLASTTSATIVNFETIFNSNLTTNLLKIKMSLDDMRSYLNNLTQISSLVPFSSLVKEAYCKIIIRYNQLANDLNM